MSQTHEVKGGFVNMTYLFPLESKEDVCLHPNLEFWT